MREPCPQVREGSENRGDVDITNPDKAMFPDVGLTKADLVGHYERVAPLMLPIVADRPLTLERYPNGVAEPGFMQKNAGKHFPENIRRVAVDRRDGGTTNYPAISETESLAYLANQGTITFHIWTSRLPDLDRPDHLIIDLDPELGDLEVVRSVTRLTGDLLASFGLASLPLATGSKGFHVWAPIVPDHPFAAVSLVARALAGLIVLEAPDDATTEFLKRERAGRVFIDWLRNHRGASVVAPYSLRPRSRAPVATPISWDELPTTAPDAWTLETIVERLALPPTLPEPQALPVDRIVETARRTGVDLDTPFDRFGRT